MFSSANFLSAGTRAAIDQALFRLMKAGTIVRVARGLYAVAGQQVDAKTVATSGLSRTVKAVGHTDVGLTPTARAMSRWLLEHSWCSRKTSAILLMDNLLAMWSSAKKPPRVPRLSARCAINQRPAKPLSNRCPGCRGIAVQILMESLFSYAWNTQRCQLD